MMELKEEGIRLDNAYKKLKIKKIKLEIAGMENGPKFVSAKESSGEESDD